MLEDGAFWIGTLSGFVLGAAVMLGVAVALLGRALPDDLDFTGGKH